MDSKTNYRSVVGKLAYQMGLPLIENHIFLDDVHSASHVLKQMGLVKDLAEDQRYCITIGHVGVSGKETAAGIRSGIERLKDNVDFIGVSDLLTTEMKWNSHITLP